MIEKIGFTILGALLTVLGSLIVNYISRRKSSKKELIDFYKKVHTPLERLIIRKEIDEVKVDLTNPKLHDSLNLLQSSLPEEDNNVKVKDLIIEFLQGGGKVHELEQNNDFKELLNWLKNKI